MPNLVLYSDCVSSLSIGHASSSSQKYELSLILELADHYDRTYIFSKKSLKSEKVNNITLVPIDSFLQTLKFFYTYKLYDSKAISFGYDLKKNLKLLIIKYLFKTKCYHFIFDRHELAISNKPFYKRMLLSVYFKTGLISLKLSNGIVVFTACARIFFKNQRVLLFDFFLPDRQISKGIAPCSHPKKKFVLIFSGTCGAHNMTAEIIEAFSELEIPGAILKIYGPSLYNAGLEKRVRSIPNVELFGCITELQLLEEEAAADVLISARRNFRGWMSFSRPSKNIEMLASGKVLIIASNNQSGMVVRNGTVESGVRVSEIRHAIKTSYFQFDQLQKEAFQRSESIDIYMHNMKLTPALYKFMEG